MPALQAEALRSANKPLPQKGWVLFSPQPLLGAPEVGGLSMREPFKDYFLVCCSLWVSWSQPPWLSKLHVVGACRSGASLKSWGARCRAQALCSPGRSSRVSLELTPLRLPHWGWDLWPHDGRGLSLPSVWELLSQFWVFIFEAIVPCVAVLCLWEEVNAAPPHPAVLN